MQASFQAHLVSSEVRSHLRNLAYGDFRDRWDALKCLIACGDVAIGPLLDLLQDEQLDWEARWFAARGLAAFDRPETIEALLQLLATSGTEELRQAAAEALSHIGPTAVMALSSQLHRPEQRRLAALALTRICHASAIAPLMQLATDSDAGIRRHVIESLGSYHNADVVPVLIQALDDSSAEVRIQAVKALSVRSDLEASHGLIQRLQTCLDDEDTRVAQAAIAALGRFSGEAAVEILTATMTNPQVSQPLKLAAIRSLGWMETPKALEALATAWDSQQPKLEAAIVAALGSQPSPLAPLATSILLEKHVQLQQQADYEPILQDLALALGRLGDNRSKAFLETLCRHEHEGVRLHGLAALRYFES